MVNYVVNMYYDQPSTLDLDCDVCIQFPHERVNEHFHNRNDAVRVAVELLSRSYADVIVNLSIFDQQTGCCFFNSCY